MESEPPPVFHPVGSFGESTHINRRHCIYDRGMPTYVSGGATYKNGQETSVVTCTCSNLIAVLVRIHGFVFGTMRTTLRRQTLIICSLPPRLYPYPWRW